MPSSCNIIIKGVQRRVCANSYLLLLSLLATGLRLVLAVEGVRRHAIEANDRLRRARAVSMTCIHVRHRSMSGERTLFGSLTRM